MGNIRKEITFAILAVMIAGVFLVVVGCGQDKMNEELTTHMKECLRLYDSGMMTEEELCSEFPVFTDVFYENGIKQYKFAFEAARRAAETGFE